MSPSIGNLVPGKHHQISSGMQDRTNIYYCSLIGCCIEAYPTGTEINDLGWPRTDIMHRAVSLRQHGSRMLYGKCVSLVTTLLSVCTLLVHRLLSRPHDAFDDCHSLNSTYFHLLWIRCQQVNAVRKAVQQIRVRLYNKRRVAQQIAQVVIQPVHDKSK